MPSYMAGKGISKGGRRDTHTHTYIWLLPEEKQAFVQNQRHTLKMMDFGLHRYAAFSFHRC